MASGGEGPFGHPPNYLLNVCSERAIEINQPRASLLTHSYTLPTFTRTTSFAVANNIIRVEGARNIRENIHSLFRGIHPTAQRGLSNLLNRPQSEPNIQHSTNNPVSNSVVVNVGPAVPGTSTSNQNISQPILEVSGPSPSNENINQPTPQVRENVSNQTPPADHNEPFTPEAQETLRIFQRYLPYLLILLAKCVYDHQDGIFNMIVLFAIFVNANNVVKKEATIRGRRNLSKLILAELYIVIGVIFVYFICDKENLFLYLVFIRTYDQPITLWDLLWIVGITDFLLKLVTVTVKIILTMLPGALLPFQKRGKVYLFIEATSQMYRSLAAIQPWLYFLLESYQGNEKIVGVFLSAAYMVAKGADLLKKIKLLKMAFFKLLADVSVGSYISKEEVQSYGDICPICHDEYECPILLECRHIFCEKCVTVWLDREQTCPLCRSKIVDDPSWRDGSTTYFMQLF